MKLRMVVAVVVAVVLAGGVAFTQGQGRVVQDRYPFKVTGDLIANCADYDVGDFSILTDYEAEVHDSTLLDADGLPVQLVENFKVKWSVYYSPETGKRLNGGPGESQQMRMLFENGVPVSHRWSGAVFKVVVPGYGPILLETGRARWIWDASGTAHWLDTNSGHNDWVDRDLEALCEYMK